MANGDVPFDLEVVPEDEEVGDAEALDGEDVPENEPSSHYEELECFTGTMAKNEESIVRRKGSCIDTSKPFAESEPRGTSKRSGNKGGRKDDKMKSCRKKAPSSDEGDQYNELPVWASPSRKASSFVVLKRPRSKRGS